jgi:hypothetical protein
MPSTVPSTVWESLQLTRTCAPFVDACRTSAAGSTCPTLSKAAGARCTWAPAPPIQIMITDLVEGLVLVQVRFLVVYTRSRQWSCSSTVLWFAASNLAFVH